MMTPGGDAALLDGKMLVRGRPYELCSLKDDQGLGHVGWDIEKKDYINGDWKDDSNPLKQYIFWDNYARSKLIQIKQNQADQDVREAGQMLSDLVMRSIDECGVTTCGVKPISTAEKELYKRIGVDFDKITQNAEIDWKELRSQVQGDNNKLLVDWYRGNERRKQILNDIEAEGYYISTEMKAEKKGVKSLWYKGYYLNAGPEIQGISSSISDPYLDLYDGFTAYCKYDEDKIAESNR